ncbi:MAG: CGGC domain-containing protein [Planctomycetota bacterium]|jgi:predicted metal-binding protein|nr:CGGC domain-containing protein [Planctomycetota bacterium]
MGTGKMDSGDSEKSYIVVVQCDHAISQVCSGFQCEHAFTARTGGFAGYPATGNIRYLSMSCGGCPGRATLRKLINLKKGLKKREQTDSGMVRVHLSTCITHSNHHGPRCPHVDYIKGQIERAGLDCVEGSRIAPAAEKRRSEGQYQE